MAQSVARVIGAGQKKDGYMEGNGYLVSWCVGHLVELAAPDVYCDEWKKWSYGSLPMIPEHWQTEVKQDTAAQYHVLKELMHDNRVDSILCATDAGREGELIFRLVYHQAGCDKPFYRLWISSMEESAIREGFAHLKPGSDYDNLYHSALCRQRADWLVGLNGTRLFTVLYGGKTLKVGRVQTPTLAMLAEREKKIKGFQKEKYYMVHILIGGVDAVTERIDSMGRADGIAATCTGRTAAVQSVAREKKTVSPPKLYDLTTLQREANRLFGFTAKQTLEYAQSLYEKKLVTYPRTDSQYLSEDMEHTAEGVIHAIYKANLCKGQAGAEPDIQRTLDSGKVTDHHAIIPTMEIAAADLSVLPDGEMNVLTLAANRLLCATAEKHEYETVRAELICEGVSFTVSGKTVLKNGWKDFESVFRRSCKDSDEGEREGKKLPKLHEGMTFQGVQTKVTEHYTQPLKRLTEDSLLSMMERAGIGDIGADAERKGLGTPATRADVIEKLVKDGFVKREKKQMIPTEDGMNLIAALPDVVKSPKLTADWENDLTLVAKGELSMEHFMADIENMISGLVRDFHEVSDEQKKMFAREQEVFGICPNCGGQVVKGKYGVYCFNKCGMNVSRVMGTALTDVQVKDMLAGKKILLKGLKSKAGKDYDAYIIPNGTEEYHYTKNGEEKSGIQFKFNMEFPKKKFPGGKKK